MMIEALKKDLIEKAIEWYWKNGLDYVWIDDEGVPQFRRWNEDFRKAMEEQV